MSFKRTMSIMKMGKHKVGSPRKKGKSLAQLMKEKVELERELDECSLAEFRLAEAVLDAAFMLEKKRKPFYIR